LTSRASTLTSLPSGAESGNLPGGLTLKMLPSPARFQSTLTTSNLEMFKSTSPKTSSKRPSTETKRPSKRLQRKSTTSRPTINRT
jgi:hypothetical protein